MSQLELLESARKAKPHIRYARSRDGKAVGGWDSAKGRFVMVASLAITNEWVSTPFEILINGEPPYKPEDWIE